MPIGRLVRDVLRNNRLKLPFALVCWVVCAAYLAAGENAAVNIIGVSGSSVAILLMVTGRVGHAGPRSLSKDEKATSSAEVKRLTTLSAVDLAAEIMPVFGPEGPPVRRIWWGGRGIEVLQICDWLMRSQRRGYRQRPRLRNAVTRGLHLLVDSGLVENTRWWAKPGALGATLRATSLGQTALADGTVRQHVVAQGPRG